MPNSLVLITPSIGDVVPEVITESSIFEYVVTWKVSIISDEISLRFPEILAPMFALSFLQEKKAMSKHSPKNNNLNVFIIYYYSDSLSDKTES